MGFNSSRAQWICSPLVGWALLSSAVSPAWAQVPAAPATTTPDNSTTGTAPSPAVPGAGGSQPTGIVPGTIVAPTTPAEGTTQDNTTPGGIPPAAGATAGSTSRPTDTTRTTGFAGLPNPQTAPPSFTSSTGQLLYGAPVGASIPTFGGNATAGELGIAVGAFTLYPAIDINTGIDSNVFAQSYSQGSTGSPYTTIVPSVELRSNWLNHELRMALTGGFGFYSNAPTQNYQNYALMVDGKIDIHEDFYITPGIGFRRATEALGTPNVAFAQAPTVVNSVPVKLGIYQRFNRFFYDAGASATRYWFTDYSTITPSGLSGANRDRYEVEEHVRLGYEITDDVSLYVQPTFGQIRYINPVNSADQERDSNNFGLGFGATWVVDPTTSFDGNIGLTSRSYNGGSFSNTSDVIGTLSGTWNRYAPLTLRPSISRSMQESSLSNYKSILLTAFGLDFSYVIHDEWTANGGVSYSLSDYIPADGLGATPRTDKIFRGQIGFMYSLRPQVAIGPVFEYTQGSSTDPTNGPSYDRETISIRLTARR
jgi:hypothetical protein